MFPNYPERDRARAVLAHLARAAVAGMAVLSLFFAGCTGKGSYQLHLVFPDLATRDAVSEVIIWALEPRGHSCDQVAAGLVKPEDLRSLSQLDAQRPFTATSKLDQVPAGDVLFAAEGLSEAGIRLLLGCAEAQVKAGATVDVTVNLICVCQPVPGTCAPIQEIPGNGIDDDCDGLTDECDTDSDCNDHNGCTADTCMAGVCHHASFPDGLQCSDGDHCTRNDACQDGICVGDAMDCSAFNSACTVGVCDPKTGECGASPVLDGKQCDNGRFCTVEDSCLAGTCQGKPRDCSDSDPCTLDACNEGTKSCDHILQPKPGAEGPPGDPTCSDGIDNDCDGLTDLRDPNCVACTSNAQCDDKNLCTTDTCTGGHCLNQLVQDGTYCDDGRYCTVSDHCEKGICVSTARDCSSLNGPCQEGVCFEVLQQCAVRFLTDGTHCDDGLFCTVGDSCLAGICQGIPNTCDDGNPCTLDTCNEGARSCNHTLQPNPGAEGPPGKPTCSNGVDDDCDGLTDMADPDCMQCTNDAQCDDQNACTDNTCNGGMCYTTPKSDGTPCGSGLRCVSGTCTCDAISCSSGCCSQNTCQIPSLGTCGIGGVPCVSCDSGIADNCSSQGSCQCGTAPVCTGSQRCVLSSCNSGVDAGFPPDSDAGYPTDSDAG